MSAGAGARSVARRVLTRVEQSGAWATLALSSEIERSRLGDKDRRLATELTYGVLRHRSRLDRALLAYAHKGIKKLPPGVRLALRVAAYQILFLERIPDHAAVDDAVDEVRRVGGPKLAGFANGLLRKLSREGEPPIPESSDKESVMARHSLPEWLADLLLASVGAEEFPEAAAGMQEVAPLCVRVNRQRTSREELACLLEEEGAKAVRSRVYDHALEITGLGSLEKSRSFSNGLWTVQDTAAQLIGAMVQAKRGWTVLDACAGVGGKTTHLAELGLDLSIDAVDLSKRKLSLLDHATKRLGLDGIRPIVADATRTDSPLQKEYDLVLLDAPCSGLGVLRRHPESKWRGDKRTSLPELCSLQSSLLDALSARVRPGGILLYSVCTFTGEEGPQQVRDFLERHPDFAMAAPETQPLESEGEPRWQEILEEDGSFRSWPHRGRLDAFYAARLRRCS